MKLTQREIRGVTVLEIRGKLIGGPDNSDLFRDVIKSLIANGAKRIVVDLHRTQWANSQGIGLLIGAFTSVKNAGGELVLAGVIDRIHDILTVTRLLLIFKTFENVEGAIGYLLGEERAAREIRADTGRLGISASYSVGLD
jgi:anti-sigma B factor antagonist